MVEARKISSALSITSLLDALYPLSFPIIAQLLIRVFGQATGITKDS